MMLSTLKANAVRATSNPLFLARHFASGDSFKFPKHKNMFSEDYYNGEENEVHTSPYDKGTSANDFEDSSMPTHRATQSGVLSTYKKQINLTPEEIMQRDYWNQVKDLRKDVNKKFRESNPETFTKALVQRLRLRRDLDQPIDKAGEEYGHYEKFEGKNQVREVNDKGVYDYGDDQFQKNYIDMLRQMDIKESDPVKKNDQESIAQSVADLDVLDSNILSAYNDAQSTFDHQAELDKFEAEKEMTQEWDDTEVQFQGRMSPYAKEKLYRAYQMGATVKDLSLKYGILPQRVKAVIYQKHLYWEEVYPRLGETHMRLALEREVFYAEEYPFVDYGSDLHVMAELEKGVKITRVAQTSTDAKLDDQTKKEVEDYLSKQKPRKYDKIPEKFVGKGQGGYMLYDLMHHKGKSSPAVSQRFRDLVRWRGTDDEHRLSGHYLKRMKAGGPRYADMKRRKR